MTERKLIVKLEFGSHLYGLSGPDSDRDYKGIVLPSKEDILMGNTSFHISHSTGDDGSKNGAGDIDTEYFSLQRFLELIGKGETVAIDMLHSQEKNVVGGDALYLWDHLKKGREGFYTKNMKSYIGYVRKQAAKYGVKGSRLAVLEEAMKKVDLISDEMFRPREDGDGGHMVPTTLGSFMNSLPVSEHSGIVTATVGTKGEIQTFYELLGRKYQSTLKIGIFRQQLKNLWSSYGARAQAAKENQGVDWKAVSHAIRAGVQAKHIYEDGGFSYPLGETNFILAVKRGELDYTTEVQPILEELVDKVMMLAEVSDYPERANMTPWWAWMRDVHEGIVKGD